MFDKSFCKLLICAFFVTSLPSAAFDYNVPEPDAGGRVGALMPYTRYESVDALRGGGAELRISADCDPRNIAPLCQKSSYCDKAYPLDGKQLICIRHTHCFFLQYFCNHLQLALLCSEILQ